MSAFCLHPRGVNSISLVCFFWGLFVMLSLHLHTCLSSDRVSSLCLTSESRLHHRAAGVAPRVLSQSCGHGCGQGLHGRLRLRLPSAAGVCDQHGRWQWEHGASLHRLPLQLPRGEAAAGHWWAVFASRCVTKHRLCWPISPKPKWRWSGLRRISYLHHLLLPLYGWLLLSAFAASEGQTSENTRDNIKLDWLKPGCE